MPTIIRSSSRVGRFRTGGILIANASSKEEVEKIITEDPLYQYKVTEMTIIEFLHARHNPALDELLGKTV